MTFSGRFLLNMIHFAARQGASATDLLAIAGHAQEDLTEGNRRVEAPVYNAVLEAALSQVPDPLLGLHAGEYFNLGAAGVIAQITQTSTTMLEALQYCCEFSMLGCRAIPLRLEKTGDAYALRMKPDPVWQAQSPEAALHTLEGHLAFSLREYQQLVLGPQPPLRVHLTRPRPESVAEFERVFKAPLYFGQEEGALFFSARQLEAPVITSNYQLLRILVRHAEEQLATVQQRTGTVYQVREAILQLMDFGLPSIEQVAANLHQSVRSLQRRLSAEGSTYQDITEDIRKTLALSYLRQPDLNLTDIAALLGYADSSTFSRSFKRWYGVAPREWRAGQVKS